MLRAEHRSDATVGIPTESARRPVDIPSGAEPLDTCTDDHPGTSRICPATAPSTAAVRYESPPQFSGWAVRDEPAPL